MKLVIISDIHSNWDYLSILDKEIKKLKDRIVIFIGDALGYYDKPEQVIQWLISNNAYCVKGNHEKMFLSEETYRQEHESILRLCFQRSKMSQRSISFIQSWKSELLIEIENKKLFIEHKPWFYSKKNQIIELQKIDKTTVADFDYYFFGHSHIPLVFYHYGCCFINPGSVGQPRDYTAKPSYAIVDMFKNSTELKKIDVDFNAYQNYLRRAHYEKMVIDILSRK